jgi:Rab3 GTPase-activating protein catalytic subunit
LDSEATEPLTENEVPSHPRKQWDDDCPWAEWYSAEDPVKGNRNHMNKQTIMGTIT